ncbi:MAG: hypothetical protein B0D92_00890 [Spirochaeta sp. LUC14_002_19_P3]|nr:MAG: hypothetical protein B0D92_00890 [Spirochaeta sp. LUC14_002_19_P3]
MKLAALMLVALMPLLHAGGLGEKAAPAGQAVTVRDYLGREVRVGLPVQSIVSLNSGLSEIIAALGFAHRLIGRDSFSTFPPSLSRVPVTARNSSAPNMETLIALQADLLLADPMFDAGKIAILEKQGMAVIVESTSNPRRLPGLVENLGRVLQAEARAAELNALLLELTDRVSAAVDALNLGEEQRTAVYFESRRRGQSASEGSGHDYFIRTAGGRNIAAAQPVEYPLLSGEFIAMANPGVIIRRVSGDASRKEMAAMREEIMGRPSLKSTDAVLNGRVHIVKSDLFIALRYPAGMAYYAALFYPNTFSLNPVKLHEEITQKLFGEWCPDETFIYP